MSNQQDEMIKLQEVGAYSTKHKPDQEEGPLLSNKDDAAQAKQIEATQDRAQ